MAPGPLVLPQTPFTRRVPASTAGVRDASDALTKFFAERGLNSSSLWRFQVAVDEVLSNIVQHGYRGESDAPIDVTFELLAGEVVVTVIDDAPPFDPLSVPRPATTDRLEDRPPGGLGIHLLKSLMDRVEYARCEGRNRLVLAARV